MKQFVQIAGLALLFSFVISCKKGNEYSLTASQKQQLAEEKEVLLPNEFLEKEGINFNLIYPPGDAQIILKLYKGTGATQTPIPLLENRQFADYAVLTNQLEENCEFTLVVEYDSVSNNGSFDMSITGYTSMNGSKDFTLPANSYTTTNAGTKKDFLRIKKGITKFTFFTL